MVDNKNLKQPLEVDFIENKLTSNNYNHTNEESSSDRHNKLDDGNYNENIQGNYLETQLNSNDKNATIQKADTVIINQISNTNNSNNFQPLPKTNRNPKKQYQMDFVFSGTLTAEDEVEFNGKKVKIKILLQHLEKFCDGELTLYDTSEGSVRLKLGGSPEDLEKLHELFKSGKLNEILGVPVQSVQLFDFRTNQSLIPQNLIGLDLQNADLVGLNLKNAYLISADLRGANLRNTDLSGAYLNYADLKNTIIDEKTKLDKKWRNIWKIVNQGGQNQNLRGTDLSYANLKHTNFNSADLNCSNFKYSYLKNANLRNTDLRNSELNHAKLNSADLTNADLTNADLTNADLTNADLNHTNLEFAKLNGANLNNANFSDAKVKNARFGFNQGVSSLLKLDLIRRGAIFEDSPPQDFSEISIRA